jgi:hypothetical protein
MFNLNSSSRFHLLPLQVIPGYPGQISKIHQSEFDSMAFDKIVDYKLPIVSIQSRGTPYTAEDGSKVYITFSRDGVVSWSIDGHDQAGKWSVSGDEYKCTINVDETEEEEADWEEDMNFILCTILTEGKFHMDREHNTVVFTGASNTGKITLSLL